MKKFLTVFLVALALFSFVGCDPASKVPTEDEVKDMMGGLMAIMYVIGEPSSDKPIVLDKDVALTLGKEYIIKKGTSVTFSDDSENKNQKLSIDANYSCDGKDHTLVVVASSTGTKANYEKWVYDGVSYDMNAYASSNPDFGI